MIFYRVYVRSVIDPYASLLNGFPISLIKNHYGKHLEFLTINFIPLHS